MADWTEQDTDGLLPGEPWTSAKAIAAFENPVAITEGAANAPRIKFAALGTLVAGDVIKCRGEDIMTLSGQGNYIDLVTFSFLQEGTVRCVIEFVSGQNSNKRVVRARANDETVVATGPGGSTTLTADVSVIHGDILYLQGDGSASTANAILSGYLKTDGSPLWDNVGGRVEGN